MKPHTHKQRIATEEPPCNGQKETYWWGLNQFYSRETSRLIFTQLQITNICSVRIGVPYLINETSQWHTCNQKHCDERKWRAKWRFEARTQEYHKQGHTLWKQAYSNILKSLPLKWKCSDKNSDTFHISAQNIDCGYSLEPLLRGGSNEYPQCIFF